MLHAIFQHMIPDSRSFFSSATQELGLVNGANGLSQRSMLPMFWRWKSHGWKDDMVILLASGARRRANVCIGARRCFPCTFLLLSISVEQMPHNTKALTGYGMLCHRGKHIG